MSDRNCGQEECPYWPGEGCMRGVMPCQEPKLRGGAMDLNKVLCTKWPKCEPGKHSVDCIPPADPSSPEIRILRCVFGLCPDCDESPEAHDAALGGRDNEGRCIFKKGSEPDLTTTVPRSGPITLTPAQRDEVHQEVLEDRSHED